MKSLTSSRALAFTIAVLVLSCLTINAADSGWVGQYADKKFLGGRAVFQLSIEQSGNVMQVSFDAGWADGHGAAPEAEGPAKISGNALTFTFKDTFENSGSGTITRNGDDIIVSINATHVADPRCLQFYGKSIRLKRVRK
jgi:hypothetical protein